MSHARTAKSEIRQQFWFPGDKLLKQALDRIKPGTVTMMHLGIWSRREPLAPVLAPLIQGLKARGYCFAPLAVAQH